MKIIEKEAFARAGLLGNPSDGYFGRTLSTTLRNYRARVILYEWPELEVVLSRQDRCEFRNLGELVEDIRLNGLYGGLRLIKAAIKVFTEFCREHSIPLKNQNFALRYETNIPRQVGMAGSSAIITATFRGLMEFYEVEMPLETLANLVLSVETEEIGIAAGLQDRVCQVYGGLVFMDFDESHFEKHGHGIYESLDPALLPPLYLAYREDLSQISGVYHSNLRERWERGDREVIEAMETFAEIAREGRECLLEGDHERLAQLFDLNFDTREKLVRLDPANVEMVHLARSLGVCAKYAGSGGSVVGLCPDEETFCRLREAFSELGCAVIRPEV